MRKIHLVLLGNFLIFTLAFFPSHSHSESRRGIDNPRLKKMLDEDYNGKLMKVSCVSTMTVDPKIQYRIELLQMGEHGPVFRADGLVIKNRFEVTIFDKDGKKIGATFEAESTFSGRSITFRKKNSSFNFDLNANIFGERASMVGTYEALLDCKLEPVTPPQQLDPQTETNQCDGTTEENCVAN